MGVARNPLLSVQVCCVLNLFEGYGCLVFFMPIQVFKLEGREKLKGNF